MSQFDSRTAKDACSSGHPSDSYTFLTSTWMTAILTDISVGFLGSSRQIFSRLVHDRSFAHTLKYNIYRHPASTDRTVQIRGLEL